MAEERYFVVWTVKTEGVILPEERLPTGPTVLVGLQHVVAMFGATVLAPILMGFDPNVAIFFSGIATLIFFVITGGRVPSYLGSSFSFIAVIIAATGYSGHGPNANLGVALGGIIAAGALYTAIAVVVSTLGSMAAHRNQEARHTRERRAEHPRRDAQRRVTDHAAQSGRQRPGLARGQAGGERGRRARAGNPQHEAHALAVERAVREQAPAPGRHREQQRDGRDAEYLHHQVGADRAGQAEHVAHGRIRRVTERGVLHRPGRERERDQRRGGDQRQAADLAQPPAQRVAQRIGEEGQAVETAIDSRH